MTTIKHTEQLVEKINTIINQLTFPKKPANLYNPIKYVIGNAGKRLRPILFLHAIQLFSKLQEDHIFPAVGLEIFHNFTLIHDDIMDNSEIRRNHLTVHKKWNKNIAILSGDAAMILATKYFLSLDEKILHAVLTEFNKMALEICEGQQYDMDFESRSNISVSEYLEMIRLKTAVFLASTLKMGAIVGNAAKVQQEMLYEAGINFGLAFQLQDDYLDLFGNQKTFGKKTGNDILDKKKTFLFIKAIEKANQNEKTLLLSLLNDDKIPPERRINDIKTLFCKLNIDKLTQTTIQNFYHQGFSYINRVNGNKDVMIEIKMFFEKMQQRIS